MATNKEILQKLGYLRGFLFRAEEELARLNAEAAAMRKRLRAAEEKANTGAMDSHENGRLGEDVAWILGEGRCDHLKMRYDEQAGLWSAESLGLLECLYSRSTSGHFTLAEAVAELRAMIEGGGG